MKKILIADDDKELCKLLQITLKSENIDSKICFSGIEAINELEKEEYIMLILDVMMPGLDGFRTLEIVRENSDIPVLMLLSLIHILYEVAEPEGIIIRGNYFVKIKEK